MVENNSKLDVELHNKIGLLGNEHKQILNRFLDLFFIENSQAIRKTVIGDIMQLSEKMNKFAYENGMTEEIAEKVLKEIS